MRYVWLLITAVVVGCQQQPQRMHPVSPQIGQQQPASDPKIVTQISQPPAFNPGNITIALRAKPDIMQTMPQDKGVEQIKLMLDADVLHFFSVAASGKDVSASDIIINVQPVLQDQLVLDSTQDGLNMKVKHYTFAQEYTEGVTIPPLVLHALARRKSYCAEVVKHNMANGNVDKMAEGAVKPDIPSSERHCSSFTEIYNFDQKMRIHLHINNVPNQAKIERDEEKRLMKEKLYCRAFNRAAGKILGKLQDLSWGGEENSWKDIVGDITSGVITDVIQYRIERSGYNCNSSQYQISR